METNKKEWATKGERSEAVVHSDNLKLEGQMQGMNILSSMRHIGNFLFKLHTSAVIQYQMPVSTRCT